MHIIFNRSKRRIVMNFKFIVSAAVMAATLGSMLVTQAVASYTPYVPYLGEFRWVSFDFCPRGWAEANGQLLLVSEYPSLFSLYGTTYGGDGITNFALPDLRGRVMVHTGTGQDLSSYTLGDKGGQEQTALTVNEMPAHNHTINASGGSTSKNPAGSILGSPGKKMYDAPVNATTTLDNSAVNDTGGSTEHENRPPYLTLRACVAIRGQYPYTD